MEKEFVKNNVVDGATEPQFEYQMWSFRTSIGRALLQGFLTSLPLVIFMIALYVILQLMHTVLTPITSILYPGGDYIPWYIYMFSLLILLSLFVALGFLVLRTGGREKYAHFETEYLTRIPMYTSIRDTVQQFAGLSKMPFSQVVLVDPYGTGVMLTGFITEEISPDMFTVFVPTAPNPTNGNIYHVPRSKLIFLTIRSDVALRTIVGMGTGSSSLFTPGNFAKMTELQELDETTS